MKRVFTAFVLLVTIAGNCLGQISLLECRNKGWVTTMTDGYSNLYRINGEVRAYMACGNGPNIFKPQLIVAIIDSNNCEPWCTPGNTYDDPFNPQPICTENNFGQMNNIIGACGWSWSRPAFYWNQSDSICMDSLSVFLDTKVPDSSYVLIYTWLVSPVNVYGYPTTGSFTNWSNNMLNSFHNLGYNEIDTIPLNHPWIFLTKKGAPQSSRLVVGNTPDATIDLSAIICHPTPIISASSTVLCEGGNAVLIAPPFLPGYLWSTGETTQVITVTEPGYYTVTVNLNDSVPVTSDSVTNCLYTDSIFIEVVSCTGIEDPSTTLRVTFTISPNPARENISITFNKPFTKQTLLNIYNVLGVLNKSTVIPPNKSNLTISVSDLAAGVYFVSMQTENGSTKSQKVIID
jgi:hypothetical protein